jgi:glycine dehydrogenase
MSMFFHTLNKDDKNPERPKFFVDADYSRKRRDVVVTSATPLGIEVVVGDYRTADRYYLLRRTAAIS